jgi:hypothetical protein
MMTKSFNAEASATGRGLNDAEVFYYVSRGVTTKALQDMRKDYLAVVDSGLVGTPQDKLVTLLKSNRFFIDPLGGGGASMSISAMTTVEEQPAVKKLSLWTRAINLIKNLF